MKLHTALAVSCFALFSIVSNAATVDVSVKTDSTQWTEEIETLVKTNIADVPVPAALWLFAPALAGLMGIRRRK